MYSDERDKIPFRFEDLCGRPEPEKWGPTYPNLPIVEKWRKLERKRELTDTETHKYGVSVGEAIRALQRREAGIARTETDLRCTAIGKKQTATEEEQSYQHWLVRLAGIRASREALGDLKRIFDGNRWMEELN